MRKSVIVALGMLLIGTGPVGAEDFIDIVKKGNQAYDEADYKKALEFYHNAETERPESPELEYNMAGALYRDGAYEQAVERFSKAFNSTDISLEADAHFNLGNTYFRMGDFQNAIGSFENSLEIRPDDLDAKYNLELARKMLKEQAKPQEQEQDQKQEQKQQDEQQQEEQQQEEQEQDEQDQQQGGQDQDQQENQDQQQQQQQTEEQKQMSKEDAERILNSLRDDEQDIQKKVKRQKATGGYMGKDW